VPLDKKILYLLASVTVLQCSYLSESLSDIEMPNINVFAVVFWSVISSIVFWIIVHGIPFWALTSCLYLFEQEMVSQLSEDEQKEVDQLNDDIRRLTEECKKMFNERLQLHYDRELLLKTTLTKQHEHLTEVSLHKISTSHPPCINLQVSDGRSLPYSEGNAPCHMFWT